MEWMISAPMCMAAELNVGWIVAVLTLLIACVPAGLAARSALRAAAEHRAPRDSVRRRPRVVVRLAGARQHV